MKEDEYALLEPGNNSSGINLTNINCVIFIYPTEHINETVVQALGRVQRASSKYKNITLYNIHKFKLDQLIFKSYMNENELIKYCKEHQLTILKTIRSKHLLYNMIKFLLLHNFYFYIFVTWNSPMNTCLLINIL
jgi:serine kinase of HPr protein (carbohydrate metabolism regulator)